MTVTSYNRNWGSAGIASDVSNILIYNPVAGRLRKHPDLVQRALAALEPRVGALLLRPTSGPRTAGPIVRQAIAEGARRVFVAGGDGTVNEVLAGMAGSAVPLTVLPAGTANVLAMETGIGGDLLRAAAAFEHLEPASVALGRLNAAGQAPRLFLLMAGVGLDASVVRAVSPQWKRRLGKLSYWKGGLAMVGRRLPEFEVRWEGQCRTVSYALLARVRNYGGDLEIARHANLLADDLALVLFEGASSLRYLKYFPGVLLHRLDGMRGVTVARARSVEIGGHSGGEIDLQVDGEYAGVAPAQVDIAPERLQLMLPRAFVEKWRR